MARVLLSYGLVGGLSIALLVAAATDLQRRQINNGLTLAVIIAAPLFWWATGLSLWPEAALQLASGVTIFLLLAGLFAAGAMGGGDVKLLTGLALWLPWQPFLRLIVAMALLGGALTLFHLILHRLRRKSGRPQVPYGVAIACAGLWVLSSGDWLIAGQTR